MRLRKSPKIFLLASLMFGYACYIYLRHLSCTCTTSARLSGMLEIGLYDVDEAAILGSSAHGLHDSNIDKLYTLLRTVP